jgi:peptide/nickel transport system substrate-binding protein
MINQGVKGSKPPTADVNLRLAIAHALDVNALNQRVYDGTGLASTKVFIDSPVDGPAYDQAMARDYVAKAKGAGWNGTVRLNCANTPEATDFSIAVQAQLEAVGIKVARENLPQAEQNVRLLTKPDYDIGCMGLSTPALGAISAINQWASTSTRNRVGVANPALDAAIGNIMAAKAGDELLAAEGEFQKIWNETIPSAMTFGQDWFNGYDPAVVKGLVFTRDAIPMFYQVYKA